MVIQTGRRENEEGHSDAAGCPVRTRKAVALAASLQAETPAPKLSRILECRLTITSASLVGTIGEGTSWTHLISYSTKAYQCSPLPWRLWRLTYTHRYSSSSAIHTNKRPSLHIALSQHIFACFAERRIKSTTSTHSVTRQGFNSHTPTIGAPRSKLPMLLRLPGAVRERIYEFALPSTYLLERDGGESLFRRFSSDHGVGPRTGLRPGNVALLRVSQLIHREAVPVLYKNNVFRARVDPRRTLRFSLRKSHGISTFGSRFVPLGSSHVGLIRRWSFEVYFLPFSQPNVILTPTEYDMEWLAITNRHLQAWDPVLAYIGPQLQYLEFDFYYNSEDPVSQRFYEILVKLIFERFARRYGYCISRLDGFSPALQALSRATWDTVSGNPFNVRPAIRSAKLSVG